MATPEMTVKQFAARLGIGVTSAKGIVSRGEVDVIDVGTPLRRRLRITEQAYAKFLKSREIKGRRSAA